MEIAEAAEDVLVAAVVAAAGAGVPAVVAADAMVVMAAAVEDGINPFCHGNSRIPTDLKPGFYSARWADECVRPYA